MFKVKKMHSGMKHYTFQKHSCTQISVTAAYMLPIVFVIAFSKVHTITENVSKIQKKRYYHSIFMSCQNWYAPCLRQLNTSSLQSTCTSHKCSKYIVIYVFTKKTSCSSYHKNLRILFHSIWFL